LLREFGGGIAAPSAKRFGHVSATPARHVVDDLADGVDLVLDGGASAVGIESTIVALTTATPLLLRPGAIGADAIAGVLGRRLSSREAGAPRASGSLPSHYAPRTPASLVASDALQAELAQLEDRDERVAVLAWHTPRPAAFEGLWIPAPDDARLYAHVLYANLRALDDADADAILIERVRDDTAWSAIADRLARATSGEAPDDRD
jgi:L-threonylcarbamoyladenylate synthase